MPAYPNIEAYYQSLQQLIEYGGSDSELNIRPAFQNCLAAYCGDHREKLALVPELPVPSGVVPDGTVKDTLRMARGYWEAKDSHDDLDAEITRKFDRGYPRDNIVFEDSRTAVLIQNSGEAMRADMASPADLHRLIRRFLDYELPQIEEFRHAQKQFKADLPAVLENLREAVEEAEAENQAYMAAAAGFLELCRQSISPDVSRPTCARCCSSTSSPGTFSCACSPRTSSTARTTSPSASTAWSRPSSPATCAARPSTGSAHTTAQSAGPPTTSPTTPKSRASSRPSTRISIKPTTPPPPTGSASSTHPTRSSTSSSAARTTCSGSTSDAASPTTTYRSSTPPPARAPSSPASSTTCPDDRLEYKYLNEIHANEVAILPYYIANLNIEYTYRERTGQYRVFPNLCFVDTLDNMDWQGAGATGGAVQRQGAFNLGGISTENWIRVQLQNEKTISVIIGNPPYNANQSNFNEFNPNRAYPEIDRRINETYVAESTAQKTKQYDMYKRFIRWASDRLADDGIVAFVTNRAYIDSLQDDGFRKVVTQEFSNLYIVDLGGNYQSPGKAGNVFGIRIGVAIGFLVRRAGARGTGQIHYHAIADDQSGMDKLAQLGRSEVPHMDFVLIEPDKNNNWLNQPSPDFEKLLPLVNRQPKSAQTGSGPQTVFGMCSLGVSTNRDEWVYDFSIRGLRSKTLFFSDIYNELTERNDESYPTLIKWSSTLRARFGRREPIVYNDGLRIQSLYRPFTVKHHYTEVAMNDRLTKNHYTMFGRDLRKGNGLICINGPGSNNFSVLAANRMVEKKYCDTNNAATFCLPLYRYTPEGERVSNITDWGIRRINDHYRRSGARTSTRPTPTASAQRTYSPTPTPSSTTRSTSTTTPPTCCASSPASPSTTSSTSGRAWAASCSTSTSASSPPSPTPWSAWRNRLPPSPRPSGRPPPRPATPPPRATEAARQKSPPPRWGRDSSPSPSPAPSPLTGEGWGEADSSPSPSTGEGWGEGDPPRSRLRADKERGIIQLDDQTSLAGVPPEAWRYRLGSRSALEWVLDQYKEKKPRDPTIRERFNTYRFADHKEHVIDLLMRVCTVSVKTMEIVDGMAYWDDGLLVVYGDRDKHEWGMMGLEAMFSEPEDEEWLKQWLEM